MDLDDTLRDRLSAAASTTTSRPLRAASTVRRSAERHRAQRRGAAAVVVVAAAATAVALGSTLGPQLLSAPPAVDPTPSVTQDPTPSPSTPDPSPTAPPTTTEAPPEPQVTQQEATAFVEAFRFEDEEEWAQDLDFASQVDTGATTLRAFGCRDGRQVDGALAVRQVVRPGPDVGQSRAVAVYADAAAAAEVFAELRSAMRTCHATPYVFDGDDAYVSETTWVGGQLELGTESFWVGQREIVLERSDGSPVGDELYFSSAALLVLDGTTVTVIDDPAFTDEGRAQFVQDATAEWERLRPQLDPVVPR
jgi:hypothetical protein